MQNQADLFKKIAEEVNEIIPTDWYKIVLYAEVLEDSSEVFFSLKQTVIKSISILMIFQKRLM